jgi:hypothetical protein
MRMSPKYCASATRITSERSYKILEILKYVARKSHDYRTKFNHEIRKVRQKIKADVWDQASFEMDRILDEDPNLSAVDRTTIEDLGCLIDTAV